MPSVTMWNPFTWQGNHWWSRSSSPHSTWVNSFLILLFRIHTLWYLGDWKWQASIDLVMKDHPLKIYDENIFQFSKFIENINSRHDHDAWIALMVQRVMKWPAGRTMNIVTAKSTWYCKILSVMRIYYSILRSNFTKVWTMVKWSLSYRVRA